MIPHMHTIRILVGCLVMIAATQHAAARTEPVKSVQPKVTQPIAPRGGVMMLPLTAERHGDHWPQTIELRTGSNRVITGQVAWIHLREDRGDRHWTDDPRMLLIRSVRPEDDSSQIAQDNVLGPYLLARLPLDADGPLRFGNSKQMLKPEWRDIPGGALPRPAEELDAAALGAGGNDDRSTLQLTPSPDRPDPVSPFEYWRWMMMADRMELNPPVPFGGEVERMAAEHYAALWRIGMARLAGQSQRIADQCRQLLTQTCIDRHQPFAAWVADPAQVGSLLSRLLDFTRNDQMILSDAVAWIDEQSPLTIWPVAEYVPGDAADADARNNDAVKIAVASSRSEPLIATLRWTGDLAPAGPDMAVRIEPGVLMEVTVIRPPLPKPPGVGMRSAPEPPRQILTIETPATGNASGHTYEIEFGPRLAHATPPGVFFRPLMPPLSLAEAQLKRMRVMPDDRLTLVQVRRLSGRWEIFAECRRKGTNLAASDGAKRDANRSADSATPTSDVPPSAPAGTGPNLPELLTSFDDLRGFEAITLLLGPAENLESRGGGGPNTLSRYGPAIWLTIPETGFWRLARGESDGTLQIHRKSYSDRWYCRIVLPESWFSAAETSPALVGMIRSHGDSNQLETGPNITTPWRPTPSRAAINLDRWDDLPASE